jgi:hypothetical protein
MMRTVFFGKFEDIYDKFFFILLIYIGYLFFAVLLAGFGFSHLGVILYP